MTYNNACKLGAQTEAEAKKMNWHRMDCLAKHYIARFDKKSSLEWFVKQDEDWKTSRANKFHARMSNKR